jgi:hypothetical protein
MDHKEINWVNFLAKVEQHHHFIGPKSQIKGYLEVFLYIYNHKRKNKIEMKRV